MFKTNDTAWLHIHKDDANLIQVIYQIISSCFEDDCADELTNEPVMTAILEKEALAAHPALSRFFNRTDKNTLDHLNQITRELRKIIYSIKKQDAVPGNKVQPGGLCRRVWGIPVSGRFMEPSTQDGFHYFEETDREI